MPTELYRQGTLRVCAVDSGWNVVVAGVACAHVSHAGDVKLDVVDDSAASAHTRDSVVGVVARALVERLRGWFHVHAGLVVNDAGAILVVGESGAGKTTTTLALAAGGTLLTDDVTFVQLRADGVVIARGLRRPLHVGPATLRMFPALQPRVLPGLSSAGKAIVALDGDRAADPVGASAEVVVGRLVFPAIDDSDVTKAQPLSPSQALPLLLQGSAMVAWPTLPHAPAHLACLSALARLPSQALRLGRDALDDPGVIAAACLPASSAAAR